MKLIKNQAYGEQKGFIRHETGIKRGESDILTRDELGQGPYPVRSPYNTDSVLPRFFQLIDVPHNDFWTIFSHVLIDFFNVVILF